MIAYFAMSLIGTLSEIKLADVLRLFASGKKTGVLTATAPGREAVLRLHKGEIVQAASARLSGDEAVLDLFGWPDGQLTFVPEEKTVTANVTHGLDVLILEGERLGRSFHRMNAFIPSDSVVFQMAVPKEGARVTVGPEEWKVVRYVDSVREVREIVEASGLSRGQVAGALFELGEAGFVEKIDLQKRLRAQGPRAFSSFSLLAPDGRTPEAVELEETLQEDWRKAPRFSRGVLRVELRTLGYKKTATMAAVFRAGLGRDVHLPRPLFQELGVREGEDVLVRPVA
jgi:DNA-binding transcriptional ArsR family regulator